MLGVRLFDTLNGSKMRSCRVCQDFNTSQGRSDEMLLPLLVGRCIVSKYASRGPWNSEAKTLTTLDFSKRVLV